VRWAHELKFDGYRIHARIDRGRVQLITARSGLDWTSKYPATAEALKALPVARAYLTVNSARCGRTAQPPSASCRRPPTARPRRGLVYYAFDLLYHDGEDLLLQALLERKARLAEIMKSAAGSLRYSDHIIGNGPAFLRQACKLGAEGIMSKLPNAPYRPGDRTGSRLKTKCLNREEFIVVGWTDPDRARPHVGALLLLAYYAPDGLSGLREPRGHRHSMRELARLAVRLKPPCD
jgi:bifunctional non-homologous end joining protein LigD